jgi:hypothetical protein
LSGPKELARLVRSRPKEPSPAAERCELCRQPVDAQHVHVVDLEGRTLCCACRACSLLLSHPDAVRGRYRTVPDRVRVDPAFTISDEQWARLQIPVELAFIYFDTSVGRWLVAYPSVTGATHAELAAEPWSALAATSLVRALAPDVEGLLVFGRRGRRRECFLVPIDLCYSLVGLARRQWRGFSGGSDFWREVDAFVADIHASARPLAASEQGEER